MFLLTYFTHNKPFLNLFTRLKFVFYVCQVWNWAFEINCMTVVISQKYQCLDLSQVSSFGNEQRGIFPFIWDRRPYSSIKATSIEPFRWKFELSPLENPDHICIREIFCIKNIVTIKQLYLLLTKKCLFYYAIHCLDIWMTMETVFTQLWPQHPDLFLLWIIHESRIETFQFDKIDMLRERIISIEYIDLI